MSVIKYAIILSLFVGFFNAESIAQSTCTIEIICNKKQIDSVVYSITKRGDRINIILKREKASISETGIAKISFESKEVCQIRVEIEMIGNRNVSYLLLEPGDNYQIIVDGNEVEIEGKYDELQQVYSNLNRTFVCTDIANEFNSNNNILEMCETLNEMVVQELFSLEDLLQTGKVSKELYQIIQDERNVYYFYRMLTTIKSRNNHEILSAYASKYKISPKYIEIDDQTILVIDSLFAKYPLKQQNAVFSFYQRHQLENFVWYKSLSDNEYSYYPNDYIKNINMGKKYLDEELFESFNVLQFVKITNEDINLLIRRIDEFNKTYPESFYSEDLTYIYEVQKQLAEQREIQKVGEEVFSNTGFGDTTALAYSLKGDIYALPYEIPRLPWLDEFKQYKKIGTIYADRLNVPKQSYTIGFPGFKGRVEWFGIDFTGKIYIENPGLYYFRLGSDDGSRLVIDNKVVVDMSNRQGMTTKIGRHEFKEPGFYPIRIQYFQGPQPWIGLTLEIGRKWNEYEILKLSEYVPLKMNETKDTLILSFEGTILFEHNEYALTFEAKEILDDLISYIKAQHHYKNVLIEGHTDNTGDVAYNYNLGNKRALAVKNYLISKGCPIKIIHKSFGETKPAWPNNTEQNRIKNRRIEVKFY